MTAGARVRMVAGMSDSFFKEWERVIRASRPAADTITIEVGAPVPCAVCKRPRALVATVPCDACLQDAWRERDAYRAAARAAAAHWHAVVDEGNTEVSPRATPAVLAHVRSEVARTLHELTAALDALDGVASWRGVEDEIERDALARLRKARELLGEGGA